MCIRIIGDPKVDSQQMKQKLKYKKNRNFHEMKNKQKNRVCRLEE